MIKKCLWCNKEFEANRSDKLYCSRGCQAKMSRFRKKNNIEIKEKVCPKCGKTFKIIPLGYNRRYCFNCVPEDTSKLNGAEQRKIIKKWAVENKGNKCYFCGYDRCIEALEFHHLDPTQKDFMISDRNLSLNWPDIEKELDKCILVCSNCHREIHAGIREVKLNDNT